MVPPAEQQQDRCCASMGDSQLKPAPGKTRAEAERLQLCLLPPPQRLRDMAPYPRNPTLCWPLPGRTKHGVGMVGESLRIEWINKQRKNRGEQAGVGHPLPSEVISLGIQLLNLITSSEAAELAFPQDSLFPQPSHKLPHPLLSLPWSGC